MLLYSKALHCYSLILSDWLWRMQWFKYLRFRQFLTITVFVMLRKFCYFLPFDSIDPEVQLSWLEFYSAPQMLLGDFSLSWIYNTCLWSHGFKRCFCSTLTIRCVDCKRLCKMFNLCKSHGTVLLAVFRWSAKTNINSIKILKLQRERRYQHRQIMFWRRVECFRLWSKISRILAVLFSSYNLAWNMGCWVKNR